jgi:hypothetical protein
MLFMKGSTHKVNNQTWLLCALIVLHFPNTYKKDARKFLLKLGITFVIVAGSCVRAGYSRLYTDALCGTAVSQGHMQKLR